MCAALRWKLDKLMMLGLFASFFSASDGDSRVLPTDEKEHLKLMSTECPMVK